MKNPQAPLRNFTDLQDTPSTYSGLGSQAVRVNSGAAALETYDADGTYRWRRPTGHWHSMKYVTTAAPQGVVAGGTAPPTGVAKDGKLAIYFNPAGGSSNLQWETLNYYATGYNCRAFIRFNVDQVDVAGNLYEFGLRNTAGTSLIVFRYDKTNFGNIWLLRVYDGTYQNVTVVHTPATGWQEAELWTNGVAGEAYGHIRTLGGAWSATITQTLNVPTAGLSGWAYCGGAANHMWIHYAETENLL